MSTHEIAMDDRKPRSKVKITIGLPVYNAMPFLPEAISSLLKQTYRDFELFVIDDGSCDGSRDYLRGVQDPRVRVISQPNRGLPATLNRLLSEANSDWLVRHDADDIAYPDRLEQIAEFITAYPDAGMFYSLADYMPKGLRLASYRSTFADPEVLRAVARTGYLLAICHPTVVLNVKKTIALGGYRTDMRTAQDSELWWRMALHHPIRLIPKKTLAYRITPSGLSSSNQVLQHTEVLYAQYLLLSELWRLPPLPFEAVRGKLETMLDMRFLQCREQLRRAAVALQDRNYLAFVTHAFGAVCARPTYLFQRIQDEFRGKTSLTVNGINPLEFAVRLNDLWPKDC